MGTVQRFEKLAIWTLARKLNHRTYLLIRTTSLGSDFVLRNQIDKSAGSVMDNIAEGFEREGNKEFIYFLSVAKGSCGEWRSQLMRAYDRDHVNENEFQELDESALTLIKKIKTLINYLNRSRFKGSKFK
ncbi:four helix bundle protein [Zeaxanthinibacter enoshimensis]|uniref:Four helix bundle protein n=1 Tax=Zeaxanthinibacter enoshimensis TaxID=392009 RepID=A0A4R6TFH4_9FLAO|nr:four helix bundle protein [Zeaxanthinibacter enoshimensis]TDQ29065.1 four helix bundle protein [Zeaxanthinibacter enoshimensis]